MDEKELCYYCKEGFEGDRGAFYVDKGSAGVVRAHKTCHAAEGRKGKTNVLIKMMPGRGDPSYGTKFMKGRKR